MKVLVGHFLSLELRTLRVSSNDAHTEVLKLGNFYLFYQLVANAKMAIANADVVAFEFQSLKREQ